MKVCKEDVPIKSLKLNLVQKRGGALRKINESKDLSIINYVIIAL